MQSVRGPAKVPLLPLPVNASLVKNPTASVLENPNQNGKEICTQLSTDKNTTFSECAHLSNLTDKPVNIRSKINVIAQCQEVTKVLSDTTSVKSDGHFKVEQSFKKWEKISHENGSSPFKKIRHIKFSFTSKQDSEEKPDMTTFLNRLMVKLGKQPIFEHTAEVTTSASEKMKGQSEGEHKGSTDPLVSKEQQGPLKYISPQKQQSSSQQQGSSKRISTQEQQSSLKCLSSPEQQQDSSKLSSSQERGSSKRSSSQERQGSSKRLSSQEEQQGSTKPASSQRDSLKRLSSQEPQQNSSKRLRPHEQQKETVSISTQTDAVACAKCYERKKISLSTMYTQTNNILSFDMGSQINTEELQSATIKLQQPTLTDTMSSKNGQNWSATGQSYNPPDRKNIASSDAEYLNPKIQCVSGTSYPHTGRDQYNSNRNNRPFTSYNNDQFGSRYASSTNRYEDASAPSSNKLFSRDRPQSLLPFSAKSLPFSSFDPSLSLPPLRTGLLSMTSPYRKQSANENMYSRRY